MALTVACVLRSGGEYSAEWVERLGRQVARHLAPERFVCLSDVPVPCERVPLEHDWPGWWSKLELFRPGLFEGLVLFLDLDTLVLGACNEIREYRGRFAALRDFTEPEVAASGVMLWRAGEVPLYEVALRELSGSGSRLTGRMDYWWNRYEKPDRLQDVYPGMIGSYKVHGLQESPGIYRIVAFHGRPRPSEADGWVAEVWAA